MRPQSRITTARARELATLRWIKKSDVLPPPQPPDLAKQAARAAGQVKFVGSVCKHGHAGIRYTISGACVDCVPFYREKNKEKIQ